MIAETAFHSDEHFDQKQFRRWLDARPASDINHYELINGRIVMTPPAGWPHGSVEAALVSAILRHVQNRMGVVLGSSAGYDLPSGDMLEPDVSFIAAKRFAAGPKPTPGKFLRIVPNLVVEFLFPSTARSDRIEKKSVYERNGVDEYWIVDPVRKQVTVFHLGKRGYGAGATFTAGPIRSRALPGLALSAKEPFTF